MAAINDWVVNVVNAVVTAFAVNFGVPLLIGMTGSRGIVQWGSGVTGAVAISRDRQGAFSLEIIRSGSVYDYQLDSANHVTITVPTTARVRDLETDFAANAGVSVKAVISAIKPTGTGSGLVAALASTESETLVYQRLIDVSQVKYYYDSTDPEYTIVTNVLASQPGPGVIYILDAYNKTGSTLTDFIDAYNNGDWFVACTSATDQTTQVTLTNHFDSLDRVLFLTCDVSVAVARLGLCQSANVAFLCHDEPDDHPEASWFAKNLPSLPTVIYKGVKDLQGQTANTTSTLSTLINIRAAKGQCYVTDSGLNIVDGGQTTDPNGTTFIDQTISRKWIKINTILALKNVFVEATAQGRRIPYTNEGIQQLIAAAAVPLQNAGAAGVIAPVETAAQGKLSYDGRYRFGVTYLTREEIEQQYPADITNRYLRGVKYWYVESGAIESAVITQTIVLSEV